MSGRYDSAVKLHVEPDPRGLLVPYPADLMTMWPVDRKVGNTRNDTADVVAPIDQPPNDLFE